MKPSYRRQLVTAVLVTLLCLLPAIPVANASAITSNQVTVQLNLSVNESLTVACTPSVVNFTNYSASAGTATGDNPVSCTVSWSLQSSRTSFDIASWVNMNALNGPTNVPSSDVFDAVDGGAATACNQSEAAGAPLQGIAIDGGLCWNYGVATGSAHQTGSQTNSHALSLAGAPNLPAGSYTGWYVIEASAS